MRHPWAIVALLLIPRVMTVAAPPATAPAERFIGEKTLLAGEADLSKVDAAEAVRWGCEVMLALSSKDAEDVARSREQVGASQAMAVRWIGDFRAATGGGACPLVAVTESHWMLDGGHALYVAVPPAGDPARVELVFGGGPEARKRKQAQPRHRFDWWSDVKIWPGGVVGYCMGASQAPPAPGGPRHPAFAEALAAGGGPEAPAARIAVVPDLEMRRTGGKNLPPALWKFLEPMKWLAVRYDAAPLPLRVPARLTLTYRARDAVAAAAAAAAWAAMIETLYTNAGVEAAEVQQIVHRLTPVIDGDRAVLSLAADEIPRLIADARPAIRKAWRSPPAAPAKSARRRGHDVRGGGVPGGRVEVVYHERSLGSGVVRPGGLR